MNNSITVHNQPDLIYIYNNNQYNNYGKNDNNCKSNNNHRSDNSHTSNNNSQYNINKHNSNNLFNIKHTNIRYNNIGHNNADNRHCICDNLLLKLIIPVIILTVITLGSIMVKASETDTRLYLKKYYTSVEVTSDDTLWSLEADYNNGLEDRDTYINNIMQLNNMTSDTIITGNHLLLYYYSSELN